MANQMPFSQHSLTQGHTTHTLPDTTVSFMRHRRPKTWQSAAQHVNDTMLSWFSSTLFCLQVCHYKLVLPTVGTRYYPQRPHPLPHFGIPHSSLTSLKSRNTFLRYHQTCGDRAFHPLPIAKHQPLHSIIPLHYFYASEEFHHFPNHSGLQPKKSRKNRLADIKNCDLAQALSLTNSVGWRKLPNPWIPFLYSQS